MKCRARSSQTILAAALSVLTPLAAVGCSSNVDTSAPRSFAGATVEVKALGLTSAGSHASLPNAARPATYASDLVVGAAHGSLLLPDGITSAATPELASIVQQHYLERLYGEASTAVQAEFETKKKPAEGDAGEILDNAVLIAWLIDQVRPADASDLKAVNKLIAKALVGGDLPPELRLVAGRQTSREAYYEACKALVPVPSDWSSDETDPTNPWKKQPDPLTPVFIGEESTTPSVWYIERIRPADAPADDPHVYGTCFALPRADSTGVITSLGVICQGSESATACFWDSARDIQPQEKVAISSEAFNGGPDLDGGIGGKCTDCHRGANAFITHPQSSLHLELSSPFPNSPFPWVRPMVHSSWFQNPAPELLDDGTVKGAVLQPQVGNNEYSCLGCHYGPRIGGTFPEFGEKHSKYCDFVIMKAILPGPKQTMPADGYEPVKYRTHYEAIATACGWDASVFGFPPRVSEPDPEPFADPVP